jgi:hypothetical protein
LRSCIRPDLIPTLKSRELLLPARPTRLHAISRIDDTRHCACPAGIFPSSYVHELTGEKFAVALYDWRGTKEAHVSLKKGQEINVLSTNGAWWQGYTDAGDVGTLYIARCQNSTDFITFVGCVSWW